jgi:hypothetical protein
MRGAVQDISFAHDFTHGILGAIDEFGDVAIVLCTSNIKKCNASSDGSEGSNEHALKLKMHMYVENRLQNPKSM